MNVFLRIITALFILLLFSSTPANAQSNSLCSKYKLVKNASGQVGLLDLEAKQILQTEYQEIVVNCNRPDLIFAKRNDGHEVYTSKGERILDFSIAEFRPSKFEDLSTNATYYKFMKTDNNYIELRIPNDSIYRFINKPVGNNSVRVEQTYAINSGLSLWSYKVNREDYDSGPIYADVCFNITCMRKYAAIVDLEKIKTYLFKSIAILPDMTLHFYKHDGRFFELK